MNTVPVIFEYQNKTYYSFFKSHGGAGSAKGDSWKLMINNYYHGQLHHSQHTGHFLFHGNNFNDMGDYFEAYMVA